MKKLFTYLLALILVVVGAFWFVDYATAEQDTSASFESVQPMSAENFRKWLSEIQPINLTAQSAVLKTPLFGTLVDFTKEITEKPKGRDNPFLPLGSDSGDATTSSESDANTTTGGSGSGTSR